ncbi:LamG-like jellyroll fold domain-containing protein [Flavobacterium sp.]|uniref:LamG-like jellyroll fold domain-containing protein n=1 Tax=Flavobacterium sp. TaxID=239 RepID=UPI00286EBA84|nr:LamG-like jellyroll fold domain-containing protein [Flavobacterium sp.]
MMKNLLFSTRFKQFVAAVFLLIAGLANAQAPTITSFSPTSGAVGTAVTITGTGFNTTASNNVVYFDGVKAVVTSATATSLTVTVPSGSTGFSKIKVLNTTSGIVYSKKSFSTTFSNGGFGNGDYNYSTNTFKSAVVYPGVSNWQTTADWKSINQIIDYDNNGFPDYASMSNASTTINVFKNNIVNQGDLINTSSFSSTSTVLTTSAQPSALYSEDINADGKMDIIVPTGSSIDIFINTSTVGTISFAAKQTITFPCSNRLRFVDFNSDGLLDVFSYSGASVKYFLNSSTIGSGTISFGTVISVTTPNSPSDFDVIDINNDNKLDIFYTSSGNYSISLGTGFAFGAFNSTTASFSYYGDLISGDLDNDGDVDFVVKSSTNAINYFTNNGSGTFTSGTASVGNASGIFNGFELANINGDSYPDVFGSNANSGAYIAIFNNTTSSNTLSYANSTNAYSASNPMGLKAADINGDGRPDIISPQYYNTNFTVIQNIIGVPTISSFTPTSGSGGTSVTITGTYFTDTTDVKFNGVSATSFTVNSSTSITAVAPAGTTGTVQVITPGGTATSGSNFTYTPSITRNATLTNFSTCIGTPSASQTVTVSGSNLTANISIAALTGYQYSLDDVTFSSTLSIVPISGTVNTTTVYVRLTGVSSGTQSGNISLTSTGATTQTVAVTGTVNTVTAISAHPSTTAQSVCQGTALTALSVTASGTSLTYQWYSNTTASISGSTLITGATSASYTPVNSTPSDLYYYCVVTGTCGTVTSNISALRTVSTTPVAGTATPSSVTLCSGNTQTLTLSGSTGSIQWQQSADGTTGWANVTGGTGATTASYTTPALTKTTYYKAVVTSGACTAANSNLVTITVPVAPRPFKQALNLDGASDKVTVANTTSLQLPNTFTIEAWVKVDPSVTVASSYMGIATKVQWTASGMGYGLDIDGGKPRVFSGQGYSNWSGTSAINTISTNTWVHLAGTYDGSNFRLYVDGQLVNTQASATGVSNNTQPFTIGSWSAENKFFKGEIDEVRVWNVTRSASQIAQYKDVELNGSESGLVAYYDLNQGTPSSNNTTITTAIDKTSNALNGTLNTFTLTGATSNWIAGGPLILNDPSVCLNTTFTATHSISGGIWTTSDATVISIDSNTGAATANAVGTATITYTFTVSGCTYTSTKLFTVNTLPAISVQPASTAQTICINGSATALSVTATGAGLTYQWYKSTTAANTGGTLIAGATSATYTPLTTTAGNAYYYCVVSGTCSPVATSSISGLIKVDVPSVVGTISSSVASICDSGTANLTLAGSTGSIQWQRFDSPIWSDLNGETNTTYTTQTLTQNRIYRAVVTNGACSSSTTAEFTVQVNASPAAPTATQTVNYCVGSTATALTATPTNGAVLQWYSAATGGTASTTSPTPITTTAGSTIYYVSQKALSGSYVMDNVQNGSYANNVANIGQTFQVANNVKINSIILKYAYFNSANTSSVLKIYNGFGGTLLATANAPFVNGASGWTTDISFSFANQNVSLVTGQTYYFEIIATSTMYPQYTSAYAGVGTGYVSGSAIAQDFAFKIDAALNVNPCESPRTAITVNVNALPTISGTQPLTVGGSNLQLTGSGNPSSSNPWVSSSPSVATISSTGVVTPVSLGSTTITYTNDLGCSTTVSIAVRDCAAPFSNALSFGVGTTAANADYVQINSRIFPSQSVTNFTIETWVKPATSDIIAGTPGNTWLSFLGYSGTKRSPSMYITNNGVLHVSWTEGYSFVGSAVSASSPTTFTANKWTHVALVKEGTTMRVYVDGIQLTTVTCLANLDLPDNAYWLGKSDQQFSGSLDEVRFWSTARTQSQIQSTMNTELAGNETGLLAYFDFNQGVAGGTNTGITTVTNKANSALNGTLTNFTRTGTTSNFVGSTITNLDIVGAATICANGTSQYTHPIVGGTWSVSNGATATISTSGLLTASTAENITLTYSYTLNGCPFSVTKALVITGSPTITNQPSTTSQTICINGTATTLSVTASGSGLTYQWYKNTTAANTGGTILAGATAATYTPLTTVAGTTYYYCVVSGTCSLSTTSDASAAIIITPASVGGTVTAATASVCSGSTASLTLSGNTGTIQWQRLIGSTWTDISGETSATLTTPSLTAATSFRAKVTNGSCSVAYSNTINITLTAPPLAPGFGLDFDGSNDIITIPNSATYDYTTSSAFTIEAWVKINTSASSINTIVGKKAPGGGTSGYAFYINSWGSSDRKVVFEATGGTFISTTSIPNNTWTHVAVSVASGGAATIYINGVASGTGTVTIPSNSNSINVGAFGNNGYFYFNGSMDEVRIWNVAKSAAELNNNKNLDVTGSPNLALYYKFNEGMAALVNDKSTNGNNGTLSNFALTGSTSNWVSSSFQDPVVITGNSKVCIGATTTLSHTITGGTWSSATLSVATIDPSTGVVTGVAVGTSVISYAYTYNGCSFTTTYTINVNVLPVISGTTTVEVGATTTLTATTNAATSNAWVSSNTNVATVTPNGLVTGVSVGTATITFTNTNGCTDTKTVTVNLGTTLTPVLTSPATNTSGASTLQISYTLPEAPLAGSVRLMFTPVGGGTPIIWTMSNVTSVSFAYAVGTTPSNSNIVSGTALAFGNYDVTLSYQDVYGSPVALVTNTNIQISAPLTTPTLTAMAAITKTFGAASFTLTAPTSNSVGAITFTSSNTSVATISGNTVTIVGAGTATITASQAANGNYLSATISTTLTVNKATPTIGAMTAITKTAEDPAFTLTAPTSNATGAFTFTSSNTAVATISGNTVTIVGAGTATITATQATDANYLAGSTSTTLTVAVGTTQSPVLTHSASNLTGATTFRINYTLPEAPRAGSVRLTFVPTSGGSPVIWTMSNATIVDFNYTVTAQPNATYVATGAALSYGTYNVTLSYQDVYSSPVATATATNIQTLAPPSITIANNSYTGFVNTTLTTISVTSTGGAVSSFAISPSLPAGLSLNTTTGAISGTPTAALASTIFTITATNPAGTSSVTFSLSIGADTDGDGVPDSVEVQQGTNPNQSGDALDTDGDGVPDYIEVQQGTNPTTPGALDTDGDGVPDYIEVQQGTNPTTPGARDTDGDGVPDYIEVQQGTNPTTPGAQDTDGDGVPDYIEVQQGTNPTTPGARDTDGDGVPDYIEVQQGTNPTTPGARDTDGDGVPDYIEVQQGTNPTTPGAQDTDGDGVPDYIEVQQGTNPTSPGARDTDGDGVPDYIEVQQGTNPTTPGARDTDGDGVPDYIEVQQGTNPTTPGARDTDGDGVPDYIEVQQGTNPTQSDDARDTDGDGLSDYYETNNLAPTDISITTSTITENNSIGTIIGSFSSTDLVDTFDPTYALVSGVGATDNASFSIVGNQIKAGIAFDFEAKSSYSIRVKTTDAGGLSYEKVFTITITNVNETPVLTVSQNAIIGIVNVPITTITVTNSGGPATSFAIAPALSAGLIFNATTGAISGTPTAAMASRTYTISGTNSDGTGIVTFNLFIDQDTDRDGILNSIDTDDDGDGVLDTNDAFPLDKNEWTDSDRDGTGNNADTDDDNDGILDTCDVDVNGDGIPDNGTDMDADGITDDCDQDKDGDGVLNVNDNCPSSPNTNQADRDHDGIGDACDTIELNTAQAFTPNGDGINDTWVIYNLSNHPGSTVRVFNANGTQVFYSANYQNNWTGNYQGSSEMLPVGSYLYQIDLGGDGSIDEQGWLYITK